MARSGAVAERCRASVPWRSAAGVGGSAHIDIIDLPESGAVAERSSAADAGSGSEGSSCFLR